MNNIFQQSPSRDNAALRIPLYVDLVVGMYMMSMPLESVFVLQSQDEVGYFTLSKMLGILFFLSALLNKKMFFSKRSPALTPLLIYLVVLFVSGLQISAGIVQWDKFVYVASTLVQSVVSFQLLYSYFSVRSPKVLWWYGACCCVTGALEALHIYSSYFVEGRSVTFGDDPNTVAAVYALSIVIVVYLAVLNWEQPRGAYLLPQLGRIAAVISIPIIITAMADSGSRGGMLAGVAGLLALIMLHRATRVPLSLKMLLALVICGGVYRAISGSESVDRWQQTVHEGDTAGRTAIYAVAWDMITERPLLGHGIIQNWYTLGERRGDVYRGVMFRGTHNQFLQVFSSLGLFGGIPFLWFLWRCLRPSWEKYSQDRDALGLALFIALMAICSSLDWDNQKEFWMILAFCAAARARPVGDVVSTG